MSGVVGQDAHLFGLLRMTFGVGAAARTKFVFVHVSDPIDSGNFTQLQHGRALASKPAMRKVIHSMTACAADVHFQSPEDCTVEHVVNKLCDVVRGVEANLITVENFEAAVEQHREQHPEVRLLEEERDEQIKYVDSVKAPRPEVVRPEFEGLPPIEETPRLRKKVKLYSKGDMVEVWSAKQQEWMFDGEVVEVAAESFISVGDCLQVAAGSMMVVFANGALYEWLTPQLVETHLRPSPRPLAPSPMVGTLLKETHGWFTFRHERYVELSKGFLRWWESEEAARKGEEAAGTVYLLNLQMQSMGQDINLRSSGTKGKIYTFEAATEEDTEAWSQALWAQSAYCQELRDVAEAEALGSEEQMAARPATRRSSSHFGGA